MIISPPFLPARQGSQTDLDWLAAAMPGGEAGQGGYPVSYNLGWHGGIHVEAPSEGGNHLPVRAIADGTVVFVRLPSDRPASPGDHPLNYRGAWTSDGCVVIRHETEIGADAQGQSTRVVFYSILMHLNTIRSTVRPNRPIYRKDEIGQAGFIYGRPHMIHFEIVCDDANLQRFVGRTSGMLDTSTDGRSDTVFGEMYFYLPAGTSIYASAPLDNNPVAHRQPPAAQRGSPLPPAVPLDPVHTTTFPVIAGLRYAGGEGGGGGGGDLYVTTYREDGSVLGDPLRENDAEYNLYRRASDISNAYPANARPAPSAVYELLRFGRVIGPDALNPADVPHWRRIRYEGGEGWVNLNSPNVTKSSDADFPHWKGWTLVDDSADLDSRCDSPTIKGWLDEDGDGKVDPNEAVSLLSAEAVQARMKRTLCRIPTEWERATVDARWGWLREETEENPAPLTDEDFLKLREHIEKLAFWEDAGLDLSTNHWHFHPREFIGQFRRCGWLGRTELSRIYPATPAPIRERYILALNIMMRRYNIQSALRQSHFLGQGAVESDFLRAMQEKSMEGTVEPTRVLGRRINPASAAPESTLGHWYGAMATEDDPWFRLEKFNSRGVRITGSYSWINGNVGDTDAQKFRGRGFKQLTGRDNYAEYWVYRGWLRRDSFDANWWDDPQYARRNATAMRRRPAQIHDPQRVAADPLDCMDSGGWYMVFRRPRVISAMDGDDHVLATTTAQQTGERAISRAVTFAINGGYIDADRRLQYTRQAKEILL